MTERIHISELSEKAFNELKEITRAEYGDTMSDQEIEEMGIRLINLFAILEPDKKVDAVPQIQVTEQEFKVLKFLHEEIYHQKRSPSVRDVAQVLGFRSSRSGLRFLNKLIERGLVYRNEKGNLDMRVGIRECNPKLEVINSCNKNPQPRVGCGW